MQFYSVVKGKKWAKRNVDNAQEKNSSEVFRPQFWTAQIFRRLTLTETSNRNFD